jgi:hypothetical protein
LAAAGKARADQKQERSRSSTQEARRSVREPSDLKGERGQESRGTGHGRATVDGDGNGASEAKRWDSRGLWGQA